jgi:autotransporter-associated beta strand protein
MNTAMLCLPIFPVGTRASSCLGLHRFLPIKTLKLPLLLTAVLPFAASAALTNYVWDGNAPNGNGNARWGTAFNWDPTNAAPPANALSGLTNTVIHFTGVLKLAPVMNSSYFINGMFFESSAGAFTLSSQNTEVLTIGSGGIANFSTNTETIVSSLNLSNAQTWSASAGDLTIRGIVSLGANVLTIAGARNVVISNVIQGGGALFKQNAGTLTLAGNTANTYSGGTTLDGGTITLAKANALGTGPLTINAGNLNIGGFNQTVGTVSLFGGAISGTTGLLNGSSYQVQSGTIGAQLGGPGSLTKSGSGITTLTGSNSFSGGTVINGGTLAVNNLLGSGTGSGNVSINNGGTLLGFGRISGTVTNRTGGTISAGSGVGLLATGNEFWFGGSTNRWEIKDAASTAGVGWDLLNIAGALSISATSSNKASIDVVSLTLAGLPGAASNFDNTQNYVWTIAQTTGGIAFAPGQSELTVFELMTGGFVNPLSGGSFSVGTGNGGKDLTLIYTVPEPQSWMFLVMGICGYLYGRKWAR